MLNPSSSPRRVPGVEKSTLEPQLQSFNSEERLGGPGGPAGPGGRRGGGGNDGGGAGNGGVGGYGELGADGAGGPSPYRGITSPSAALEEGDEVVVVSVVVSVAVDVPSLLTPVFPLLFLASSRPYLMVTYCTSGLGLGSGAMETEGALAGSGAATARGKDGDGSLDGGNGTVVSVDTFSSFRVSSASSASSASSSSDVPVSSGSSTT